MKRIDSINNPSLQPFPQNVQANVSHNINSGGGAAAVAPQQTFAEQPTFPVINQAYNAMNNQPGFNFLIPTIIFIIALIGFIWFLRKK